MDIKAPWELPGLSGGLASYRYRFLAEGDSWFSIGELPPWATSNLLFELRQSSLQNDVVVTCAHQGDTLTHMVEMWHDANFTGLLDGPIQRPWDGILLSAGGNDLIDASLVPGSEPSHKRLLLLPHERPAQPSLGSDYVSETGWQLFLSYLQANIQTLIERRDHSPSHAPQLGWKAPIFLHTYHQPTVRNAPAGTLGPWLYTAVTQYHVPEPHWQLVGDELFSRLRSALLGMASDSDRVFVFDSSGAVTLAAAVPGSTGASGDWQNEIHLTPQGYRKVASALLAFIDNHMP